MVYDGSFELMRPAQIQRVDLAEDIMCGTSNTLLIILGLGMGWLVADKFMGK